MNELEKHYLLLLQVEYLHNLINIFDNLGNTCPDPITLKIGEDFKSVASCIEPGAPTPAQRSLLLAAIKPTFVTEYLFEAAKIFKIAANVHMKAVPGSYAWKTPVLKKGLQLVFPLFLS